MSVTMRILSYLATTLLSVLLSACGGGGGSPGLPSGSTPTTVALFTTVPAVGVTLAQGTSGIFAVGGGVAPYLVTSANSAIAIASVSGTALTINGVGGGTTAIEVRDSGGSTKSITITVTSPATQTPIAMFTTAPSNVNIANGATVSYSVNGGIPPYTVTSDDLSVVRATINGTSLTVSAVGGGRGNLVVKDSVGTSELTISVAVGSSTQLFINAPSAVNFSTGGGATYTVSGGTAPYSVTTSDARVVSANIVGSVLSVAAGTQGAGSVQITDASGNKLTLSVTVAAPTKFYYNAPSAVTLLRGTSATYLLSGGSYPYSVVSSDVSVATASIVGTALNVAAQGAGTASLQITDAQGTPLLLSVTVTAPVVTVVSQDPVLRSAILKDANGVTTNSLSASGYTTLSVTLTDPSGNGIPNQVIDVTGDAMQVAFPEGGGGLTNSGGVANIKIARASLLASGAGSLTISYSYKVGAFITYPNGTLPPSSNKTVTTYVGYQLSASNITLTNLDVGTGEVPAYGTRQISVQANVNGVAATSTPVLVNFTATCGQVSPITASTNSSGVAVVSYTATDAPATSVSTLGCSGKTVEISASTVGASVVTRTLNISSAPATNLSFLSATPSRIYLDGAGGPTQSIVEFKLVNARGEAILGQDVSLTLKTLGGGVPKASIGTVGSISSVRATTDANGKVSVPVFSGTVPTSVLVNAALVANPLVQTDSAVLTIASGRPAQARVSLAIGERAIRGFDFDGAETSITLALADRQGNPVPDGTAVNFVTEGGVMIPPVCITGAIPGDSRCTVKVRSQNPRPTNGLVTILAYASGEEDFVDANFNNIYDCGEAFTDLGIAYRDDAMVGGLVNPFITGQFSVPRSAAASSCAAGVSPTPSTGDGVWGAADVRMQTVLVFSTDDLTIDSPVWVSAPSTEWTIGGAAALVSSALTVTIKDLNAVTGGNSIPTGSTIEASATDTTDTLPVNGTVVGSCSVTGQSHVAVPNTLGPLSLQVYLKNCIAGDQVKVKVTTPALVKSINFTVP